MALVVKDRVRETTTTTGTGTITLLGAAAGFQSFSVIGNANTTYYTIVDANTGAWEVGIGTYTSSGTTLSRDTILESSSGGSAINFAAGTKDVFVVYPAEKAVYQDATGVVTLASSVLTTTDINGGTVDGTTIGASSASTGAFTTLSATGITTVAAGSAALPAIVSTTGTADTGLWFPAADTFAISTAGAERMRIDSTGAVGIGGTPSAGQTLVLNKSITGNVNSTTIRQQGIVQSDVTTSVYAFDNVAQTAASVFTLAAYRHFSAQQGTFGAGSTVTNQYGYIADGTLTGASNNYGFYSNIASGTGRYNFYAAGTAANYFAGSVGIGDLPSGNGQLRVAGNVPAVTDSWGVISQGGSQASSTHNVFYSLPTVTATSVLNALTHFYASQSTLANTVNSQYGFRAESSLTGATNNYGFYGNIASGANRFNFYAAGTAANVFAGTTSIGGAVGSESLRVTPVASSVNYINASGAATTVAPSLAAAGSDTNIDIKLTPKGTGGVVFPAGAVGTPSITATGDTNTGIFFPAADTIAFAEGGAEAMRIDSSGNVGIGTISPNQRLQVTGSNGTGFAGATLQNSNANVGLAGVQFSSDTTYSKSAIAQVRENANGAGPLVFYVDSATDAANWSAGDEKMRIDSSGNLLVGTTVPYATGCFVNTVGGAAIYSATGAVNADCFSFNSVSTSATVYGIGMYSNASAANTAYLFRGFHSTSTFCFGIAGSGNVTNTNNSYGAISDIKLKENIIDATPKLNKLNQVRVVNYNFIGDTQKQLGVVAQELEHIFPSLVEESVDRDKEGKDLGTTTKSVKYSVFVPMLIKAIQEQQALIQNLTTRLNTLEGN